MKKKWIIIYILTAVLFVTFLPDVRHDYKRYAGSEKLDTGRIATIKLRS